MNPVVLSLAARLCLVKLLGIIQTVQLVVSGNRGLHLQEY
jgi:hypothetical protein